MSYILEAVEDTAKKTCQKIHKIRELLDGSLELARHQVKKGYSKELIELVFQQPYCRIQSVEKAGLAKRETASAYLKELEWVGILRGVMIGREKYYLNDRLFSVLAE